MWKVEKDEHGTRVWPLDDLREHTMDERCWCKPFLVDGTIVVHNAMDGRERFERGERKAS